MSYQLTGGDHNVVSNLRSEYEDRLIQFTDEHIAQAWREFSQSDEYSLHKTDPGLFIEWAKMAKAGVL